MARSRTKTSLRRFGNSLASRSTATAFRLTAPFARWACFLLPIRIAAGVEASITLEVTEHEEPAEEPEAAEEAEASDSEVPEIDFSR